MKMIRKATVIGAIAGLCALTPFAASQASVKPWLIRTVAGGIGGPGPASQINSHANCAVTFADGSLYGTEFGLVRRISLRTGRLDTPVGTGFSNDPSTDGLLASQTGINYDCGIAVDSPSGVAVAPDGSVLPADNGRIRRVRN